MRLSVPSPARELLSQDCEMSLRIYQSTEVFSGATTLVRDLPSYHTVVSMALSPGRQVQFSF